MKLLQSLLPGSNVLQLDKYELDLEAKHLTLHVSSNQTTVQCPVCGRFTHHIHSHYERTLADLPCVDVRLTLLVQHQLELPYVLAICSNHAVLLPKEQWVRSNRWREYQRTLSNGHRETRFIREIIYGKRRAQRYWELTTDPQTLPSASTWMVMTWVEDISYHQVGDLYGLRDWVEYGLKQSKNELGWADFRVTDSAVIEKWWEVVMSAYLMVTLNTRRSAQSLTKRHTWL